ncbi:unnamed protein product [Cuscuta epithymum]|uniref:Uncharacterized protein n=1 Tax=Cuscuta epithymum TaxID=186058 RepID=A0AAV0FDS4_9ASTE|nr:unnamed protein product [Cuscuta epithymum]
MRRSGGGEGLGTGVGGLGQGRGLGWGRGGGCGRAESCCWAEYLAVTLMRVAAAGVSSGGRRLSPVGGSGRCQCIRVTIVRIWNGYVTAEMSLWPPAAAAAIRARQRQ